MVTGLDGKIYQKQLGLFCLKKRRRGGPHGGLQLPHKGIRSEDADPALWQPATGPKSYWNGIKLWWGGSGWLSGKGSSLRGWSGTSDSSGKWSQHWACHSWRSIWTTLSDIWSDFWVVLCGGRSWTQWSMWVPSNLGYSVTSVQET